MRKIGLLLSRYFSESTNLGAIYQMAFQRPTPTRELHVFQHSLCIWLYHTCMQAASRSPPESH